MKLIKEIIYQTILAVVALLVIALILEGATRLYFRGKTTTYDYRLSQPIPYQNSSYFSEEFIKESFKQPGKWINPPGTRIIYPQDFNGKYFHVSNNCRVTTNQPQSFANTVYLYGGSTIYCSEVPDTFTVASYLQRKINQAFTNKYRVVNLGATSINTFQELQRLETIKLQPDDIVIFYGGVNDGNSFSTGRVNGWIMGENYTEYSTKFNFVQKVIFHMYNAFSDKSEFVSFFLNPFSYQTPEYLKSDSAISKMQAQLFTSYTGSVIKADSICKLTNTKFFNFLQPCAITKIPKSKYEEKLLSYRFICPKIWTLALEKAYPTLIKASNYLNSKGIFSGDLTKIFNSINYDIFLDYCHVTEKGNDKVASAIFTQTFKI